MPAAGVRHEETLTGFKWIGRVPGLRYGYEEALGYCVDPGHVRDKDGVSAALLVAELAATLKAQGRTLADRLDDLARAHGVHATDALAVRVEDLSLIGRIMDRLRADSPTSLAGVEVVRTDDLARGDGGLPPTEGLRYYLADESRVIVRPSGTEPKLKVLPRGRRARGGRGSARCAGAGRRPVGRPAGRPRDGHPSLRRRQGCSGAPCARHLRPSSGIRKFSTGPVAGASAGP